MQYDLLSPPSTDKTLSPSPLTKNRALTTWSKGYYYLSFVATASSFKWNFDWFSSAEPSPPTTTLQHNFKDGTVGSFTSEQNAFTISVTDTTSPSVSLPHPSPPHPSGTIPACQYCSLYHVVPTPAVLKLCSRVTFYRTLTLDPILKLLQSFNHLVCFAKSIMVC